MAYLAQSHYSEEDLEELREAVKGGCMFHDLDIKAAAEQCANVLINRGVSPTKAYDELEKVLQKLCKEQFQKKMSKADIKLQQAYRRRLK